MVKRITQEEFLRRSKSIWGDRWGYEKAVYKNMISKILLNCRIHGDFEHHTQAHLKGIVGCASCNGQTPIDKKAFIEKLAAQGRADLFDYSKVVFLKGGIHQKITLICKLHNEEFTASGWSTLQGKKSCRKCNKNAPYTYEKFKEKVEEIYPNKKYDYSKVDLKEASKKKSLIGCPEKSHGFFRQSLLGHLSGKEGCKICALESRRISLEEFLKRSKEVWGDHYDYSETLTIDGFSNPVNLRCKTHGSFTYIPSRHLLGLEGCLKCRNSQSTSKAEKELGDFIESLGVTIERNNRTVLSGKELDIYCPNENFAVEYNGIYYHSEDFVGKDYHKNKRELANAAGVTLLQIWEDDWNSNKELVKEHLRHKLGKSERKRFYARKLQVKEVSSSEARVFFNENHIQGAVAASKYFGLYSGEELVALAGFLKSQQNYTLIRYATNSIVVGGHSKLINFFEKNFKYEALIAFADYTFSSGELYEATGWTFDSELAPDYSYIVNGVRKHKFNYRKQHFASDSSLLFEEDLTESELADLNCLLRIWDAGKARYVKTHPDFC